jgi:type II secretory pathway pseudopilin PulG
VELLVVISIIGLLVTILVPVVSTARDQAELTRTTGWVQTLGAGCHLYWQEENNYYPGQQWPEKLAGTTQFAYTGSEYLVMALRPKGYAPIENSDIMDPKREALDGTTQIGAVSDRARSPAPVLYYPARKGEKEARKQYKWADNKKHVMDEGYDETDPNFNDDFLPFITDDRWEEDSETPYNPGTFLIIARGLDKGYFTEDSPPYPNR